MNNYIVVNKNKRAFEAFNCETINEAIYRYLSGFVNPKNNYFISFTKIYNSNVLSIAESLELFYAIFEYAVDSGDYIETVYGINCDGIDFKK